MEKNVKRTYESRVINTATGEVTNRGSWEVKYFDADKGYLFFLNRESVKTFKGFGLPDDLSESDVARVYRLSLVTHSNTNLICFRSHNTIRPMSIKAMGEYLKISYRQSTGFVNRMIAKHIIGKVKVTVGTSSEVQYYLNPLFFFNGKWLNANLYLLFKSDLDYYLPSWVKEKFSEDLKEKA